MDDMNVFPACSIFSVMATMRAVLSEGEFSVYATVL